MAKIENINVQLILKWEGGLSKDPKDPAAAFPVPDGSGFHTNKGITWKTFSGNAARWGYAGTVANFKEMPNDVWLKIYQHGFWNSVKGDLIDSQAIAEFMADWAWGSGPQPASKRLQMYLNSQGNNLGLDGKIGPVTLGILNKLVKTKGERVVFEDLDRYKRDYLKRLRGFPRFGKGWFNRMDDFKNYALSIIH